MQGYQVDGGVPKTDTVEPRTTQVPRYYNGTHHAGQTFGRHHFWGFTVKNNVWTCRASRWAAYWTFETTGKCTVCLRQ